MGEAKAKEELRRVHARKIVAAFEAFIEAKIDTCTFEGSGDAIMSKYRCEELHTIRDQAREGLIDVLITPPPKP